MITPSSTRLSCTLGVKRSLGLAGKARAALLKKIIKMICSDENRSSRANVETPLKEIEKKDRKHATVPQAVKDVPKPLTEGALAQVYCTS